MKFSSTSLNIKYKTIHSFSWIFLVIFMITFIAQVISPHFLIWQNINYLFLLSSILFLYILNRVTSYNGLKNEQIILSLVVFFLSIDLIGLMETVIAQPDIQEFQLFPYRLTYAVLFLSIMTFALNHGPIGLAIKNILLKFKEPRAFIILALFFLILCPFFLFFKYEPIAERSANLAYLFLVIGVLGQFILYLRQHKNKKETYD